MTFRLRLVAAVTGVAVLAVVAACIASYFTARNSLYGSADGTLHATATYALENHPINRAAANGLDYQWVAPSGEPLGTAPPAGGQLPVSPAIEAVASGRAPAFYDTITWHGQAYREYVVYAGTLTLYSFNIPIGTSQAALQVVSPLSSLDSQLFRLGLILLAVGLAGVALAVLLGWLVGRAVLAPLDSLTSSVEDIADTTDVSRRLAAGGADELGRLRRAFNRLLAALERSREAQRQLVLDAGHELRTPLTSLRTNLEVVRRLDELPPAERQVLVDDLLTQMQELTNLVGDLSELARGEQRHQERLPMRLDQLVEEAVAMATTHGRRRDIQIQLHSQPTWIRAQHDRVARAVGNLLDNAVKWSPDGGLVEVAVANGIVTVRDHGPGIAPEDLAHVFDRFYRSSAARALPGSGLGLAIVAQVAEAEGGEVAALAAPGGGALLRLAFPPVAPPLTGAPEEVLEDSWGVVRG